MHHSSPTDRLPEQGPGAVYLAPRGFEADLEEELRLRGKQVLFRRGRLFGTAEGPFRALWADNIWLEPRWIPVPSISGAAKQLKAVQRNWALFSTTEHRRAHLIEEALPGVSARPLVFGGPAPTAPLGSWTLWSRDMLLASPACSSPFRNGQALFQEDKTGPPNRAYLKLWELFTRVGQRPGPGDLCLDLGSSPGGWTWALAHMGAKVFSVDKAPLAPDIARHPLVEFCNGSAFALEPALAGHVDWLFCDVACYPDRLYSMLWRWLESDVRTNFICTVKFSGPTDFTVMERFTEIANSYAVHLSVNKHELTWFRLVKEKKFIYF